MKYITEIAVLRYHTISMTALLSENSQINGGHETGSDSLYSQLECFWGTCCPSIIVLIHKQQSIYEKPEAKPGSTLAQSNVAYLNISLGLDISTVSAQLNYIKHKISCSSLADFKYCIPV